MTEVRRHMFPISFQTLKQSFKVLKPGGYCWEFLWVCRPVLQYWLYFRPKNVIFHARYSDLASEKVEVEVEKLCHHYLRTATKNTCENTFRIRIFLSFSFSYTPVVPDQNGQEKRRKNYILWGGTCLYALYKGVPPLPRIKIETKRRKPPITNHLQTITTKFSVSWHIFGHCFSL